MAPKKKFSKENIIDAAFDIAREQGIDQITIRKVADKLGCSIAPIYVNFTDIETLKKAVIQKISDVFQQMMMTKYSDNPFRNIGIASIKIARQYPIFFRDLIMNRNTYLKDVQPSMDIILKLMRQNPELTALTDEELSIIFLKMRVFQLGLSVMDVNGLLPEEFDEDKLIELMGSMGNDVITSAHLRNQETK